MRRHTRKGSSLGGRTNVTNCDKNGGGVRKSKIHVTQFMDGPKGYDDEYRKYM